MARYIKFGWSPVDDQSAVEPVKTMVGMWRYIETKVGSTANAAGLMLGDPCRRLIQLTLRPPASGLVVPRSVLDAGSAFVALVVAWRHIGRSPPKRFYLDAPRAALRSFVFQSMPAGELP